MDSEAGEGGGSADKARSVPLDWLYREEPIFF